MLRYLYCRLRHEKYESCCAGSGMLDGGIDFGTVALIVLLVAVL